MATTSGSPPTIEGLYLSHLHYFRAIAHATSLSEAARGLGIRQPTLSHALAKLEAHFKTRLALRDPQGVTLTQSGRTLLLHIEEALDALNRASQLISELESELRGRFVLGCHESLGAYFLPGLMPSLLRAAPNIELQLWSGSSKATAEAVLRRTVDFGLVVNPHPHPDLVMLPLFRDAVRLVVAASDQGVDADLTFDAALEVLRRGPLVFAGEVTQSDQILEFLNVSGWLPERLLNCGDMDLVKSLVKGGLGVGILPHRVAQHPDPGRLRQLHPELPHIPDRIDLIFRADRHRTSSNAFLKDALLEHGRGLSATDPD